MKIYFVIGEPFPNGWAATNRIKCYARAIKESGIDCEVLVSWSTELPEKVMNPERKGLYKDVPFYYPGGTPIRSRYRIIRPFFDYYYKWKTILYLRRKLVAGDVVFLYLNTNIEYSLRLMKTAHKKKAFCVRDLCELPYGTGAETKKAIKLREKTFESQFPKLDGIISISDALLDLAKKYTKPQCKHIKVPIMVDYEFHYIEKNIDYSGVPYIFHAGTLYQQKDGILGMIEAFGKAKNIINKPIKYILTGDVESSSHPSKLKNIIKKYQLEDSVEFVGYLYQDQIKNYLKNAFLVISNRPKSQQDYYGFSTKVGEYLASGTPMITTRWGEAMNWLQDGSNAYIIEPENVDILSETIVHVYNNMEEAQKIGKAGQDLCRKRFDYRVWSTPLADFFRNINQNTN